METLFFFTTSLNFGNIFSSESISPESFYTKRGFGFDYYENPFPSIKDYVVFFEDYPKVDLPISIEIDLYKIVLEFNATDLQVQKSEISGIWLCPNTVFLSLKNLKKVYFCSQIEKNKIIAKAESSKALKVLPKYEHIFATTQPVKQIKYNLSNIKNLPENKDLDIHVERDRLFNKFKGFIYGLICGKSNQKNPNEIAYINSLQEIKNGFALLKNSLAHNSFNSFRKEHEYNKTPKNIDYNTSAEILRNLKKAIDESERIFVSFIDTIGNVDYVLEYLKLVVFKNFEQLNRDHIHGALQLAKYMRGLEKNLEKEAIIWFWENNPNNPFILYEIIKYSVQGYRETSNKEKQDDYDSAILKSLFRLEKYAEIMIRDKSKNEPTIDFNLIELKNVTIKLPEILNKDDKFEQLINMVLHNAKKSKGKVNDQQLIPLVECAGEIFKEGQGRNSNLYRYLTKRDTLYQEKSETPTVMRNFTAFVFNPNEIEKLQKYIGDKGISESQYAFAFFGTFNGFASLSKDFTRPIFEKKEFQSSLDNYFHSILIQVNQTKEFLYNEAFIEPSEVLSDKENVPNTNPLFSTTNNLGNESANQEFKKIDLHELKEDILLKAKSRKIIKPSMQNEFNDNLDNSLKVIDKILADLPYGGQEAFIKNRLVVLFTTKYKMQGLGEQRIKKLFD